MNRAMAVLNNSRANTQLRGESLSVGDQTAAMLQPASQLFTLYGKGAPVTQDMLDQIQACLNATNAWLDTLS
jgi:hypothetical protein